MDYIVLWISLVLTAAAAVYSLVLWRQWRDTLLLVVSALLGVVLLRSTLVAAEIVLQQPHGELYIWVELVAAGVALATVTAAGRFMQLERRRRRQLSRIDDALNEAERGLAQTIGYDFLRRAVHSLTEILDVESAFIAELRDDGETADVLALSVRGEDSELFTYELANTPCADVVGKEARAVPSGVQAAFPDDPLLVDFNAEAYIGVPLFGQEDRPLGVLAVVHTEPIADPDALLPALRIIAARVETELQRERQNRELRESESRYRNLFDESLEARLVTNWDGRLLDVNQSGVELFGYDSREQMMEEFLAAEHYGSYTARQSALEDLLREGSVRNYPIELKRRDGSLISTRTNATTVRDDEGRVIAIRSTLRDVSREHELQRQLLSSQRMEAVGLMAGGVAHDFNNMLTIINGHSDLLLDELEQGSRAADDVREIKAAAQSAAAFTRRLLLLSRRQVLAPGRIDLAKVMGELSVLLEKAVGADITLELDLDSDLGEVIADASEMEQVLLNLVINSRDAMPHGGTVSIAVRRVELGDWEAIARDLEPGSWVELEVRDTGLGIEPDVVDRIFEPFFTTKDATIGTGLGLSTVYGIVRQLGGDVSVESTVGEGTAFSILIPPAAAAPEAVPAMAPSEPERGEDATLLVVDDEPAVRDLLRRALERQGYRVLLAANGREALDSLRAAGRVDLLISDMMMPGLHGDRLAKLAREQQGDLPVLLISGNSHSGDFQLGNGAPSAFLSKPFSALELGAQVRELLGYRSVEGE